jgi:lysophospholipase L1-like esterase
MKKLFLIVIVNIAVFCTLIILTEIAGQIFYYITHGRFVFQNPAPAYQFETNGANQFQYYSMFEQHPLLAARPRKNVKIKNYMNGKEITTTDRYTRWTGAPEDDSKLIRVAVLGGSTTFGTGVTDSDSWPALLQAKLGDQFSVINYGVPCYSTAEAIIQMALTVPEIKPEFVIFYQGWNDIVLYHEKDFSPDFYSQGMEVQDCVQVSRYKEKTSFEKLSELSAIVRLASIMKSKLDRHSNAVQSRSGDCAKYDTPDPAVDNTYVRNLKTLKLLSEQIAPYTLFVPQILNSAWYREKDTRITFYDCAYKIKNSAMPRLMDRFNMLEKSVCPFDDSKCIFVNGVLNTDWEPEDFVDDGHFSRKGGEKFTDIISRVILSKVKEKKLRKVHVKYNAPN